MFASRIFDAYIALWQGAPRWMSFLPLALLASVLLLWVFRLTSRPARIRRARQRLLAHLLEMRLFGDEPLLVLKAQGRFLRDNFLYLGWVAVPVVCSGLVLLPLFAQMERYYASAPLVPGRPALFSIQIPGPIDFGQPPPVLQAPPGLRVETPVVRIAAENRYVWRISAETEVSGVLRAVFPRGAVEKSVEAGWAPRPVTPLRPSTLAGLLLHPGEPRLDERLALSAEIEYPSTSLPLAGFQFHWAVLLLLVSLPVALLLKRRFGVEF